jgi:hypothetical protein
MAQYSREHSYYLKSGNCPSGLLPPSAQWPVKPHKAKVRIIGQDGTRRAAATVLTQLMVAAMSWAMVVAKNRTPPIFPLNEPGLQTICNVCGGIWPVIEPPPRRAPPRAAPKTAPSGFLVLGISNARRIYEADSDEPKYVDNLESHVPFKRTIRITRRWTESIQIQTESAREAGTSGSLGLGLGPVG